METGGFRRGESLVPKRSGRAGTANTSCYVTERNGSVSSVEHFNANILLMYGGNFRFLTTLNFES